MARYNAIVKASRVASGQTPPSTRCGLNAKKDLPAHAFVAPRHGVCPGLKNMTENMTEPTRVLYNAQCPVCNFEIKHYARYSEDQALPLGFDDLNSDALANWCLTVDQAARRLYVLHQGNLTSGIEGFLVLWAQMPRYRRLGRLVGCPGIKQISSAVYDYLLAPAIYRWHLHRQARLAR